MPVVGGFLGRKPPRSVATSRARGRPLLAEISVRLALRGRTNLMTVGRDPWLDATEVGGKTGERWGSRGGVLEAIRLAVSLLSAVVGDSPTTRRVILLLCAICLVLTFPLLVLPIEIDLGWFRLLR
ncbi:hypothetical protein C1701_17525 [Actinoalloteichus sp. AHMU CJ021]|nr:hypothetical protein C1701_17525 [Actinoalloteichus sp. AHMU CJ021]